MYSCVNDDFPERRKRETMKTCAIVGINWGDEGKGRVVDLLTADYDIVIRYQGGGNAGEPVEGNRGSGGQGCARNT